MNTFDGHSINLYVSIWFFRWIQIDCCAQHADTQFAYQTNNVYALLCAAK